MSEKKNEQDKPTEVEDQDLDAIEGGVGMLLPTDQKLPDGSRAPETVAIVLGDGSVKFIKSNINPQQP